MAGCKKPSYFRDKKKVFHSFWSTEPMLQNVVQWLMFNACAVSHEGLSEWEKKLWNQKCDTLFETHVNLYSGKRIAGKRSWLYWEDRNLKVGSSLQYQYSDSFSWTGWLCQKITG